MTRKNFTQQHCSVAQCLSLVGDIWSFLIIRDAMAGKSRFSEFEKNLGIAKNILKNRLNQLVDNEIMVKINVGQSGTRYEYQLSEKGKDLFPIMISIFQWSEKWVEPEKRSQFHFVDSTGNKIGKMFVPDAKGNPLTIEQISRSSDIVTNSSK